MMGKKSYLLFCISHPIPPPPPPSPLRPPQVSVSIFSNFVGNYFLLCGSTMILLSSEIVEQSLLENMTVASSHIFFFMNRHG